jgi:hypothetical protein
MIVLFASDCHEQTVPVDRDFMTFFKEVQERTAEYRMMNVVRRRTETKSFHFIIRNSLVASGAAEGG